MVHLHYLARLAPLLHALAVARVPGVVTMETENNRTDALVAAIWRAVAKAMASSAAALWTKDEQKRAIRCAEHVEEMLRLTGKIYQ